jgi:hypothetical protein
MYKNKAMNVQYTINVIWKERVVYGCETWSLTLKEKRRLKLLENRVLRRIFGIKRDEVKGSGENYIMRSLITYIPHPILFG